MKPIKLLLIALAAALLAPAAASAAPTVDGEFALTSQPRHLTLGPDGNIWVALDGSTNDVAKVTPDGTVTEYSAATISGAVGITTGPDNNLWVTQPGGVARFSPADPTAATPFAVADIADPRGITAGSDGNLWTASGDKAIRITTAGTPTSFPVAGMSARGIAAGGDGRLYIADFGGARIVALTTAGDPTFFATGGGPQEVAAGPGNQIAYSNPTNVPQQIGRITPPGDAQTNDVPGTDPFGMTFGPDGAYWVANFANATLNRLTTDGTVTPLSGFSAASGPRFVTAGPGNTLWVSLETANKVARVTGVTAPAPSPTPTPTPSPTPTPTPGGDTTAPVVSDLKLPKRAARKGTLLRFSVSENSRVTLSLQRGRPGRRSKGRCVKPAKRLRSARTCVRFGKPSTMTLDATAGANRVRLKAVGSTPLRKGRYRIAVSATDAAGNASQPITQRFRLKAARRK